MPTFSSLFRSAKPKPTSTTDALERLVSTETGQRLLREAEERDRAVRDARRAELAAEVAAIDAEAGRDAQRFEATIVKQRRAVADLESRLSAARADLAATESTASAAGMSRELRLHERRRELAELAPQEIGELVREIDARIATVRRECSSIGSRDPIAPERLAYLRAVGREPEALEAPATRALRTIAALQGIATEAESLALTSLTEREIAGRVAALRERLAELLTLPLGVTAVPA